jgi:hypothetical protein
MDEAGRKLEELYSATTYRVFVPAGPPIDLRIGARSAELDLLLTRHGAATWAFITAFNPGSQPLAAADNEGRHAELLSTLKASGSRYLTAVGIPNSGEWQPEASVIVLDIATADAIELAKRFGQNAIVAGRRGGEAELVYC